MGISAFGLRRAFGQSDLYRGNLVGSLGLLASMVATAGFSFLLFVGTSQIPEPTKVTQDLQAAPDFTLTNQLGKAVQLSSFEGKKVVLDFYRGHW